ncbi:MAG: succinate dehydrogenase assembly factor 2 [Marinobacter sp.]
MQDPKAPADNSDFNRLWWHSRRGMLELDVLLIPFLEEAYRDLDKDDQARYERLLTCEDTDMFEWFMQRSRPADADLQRIVDIILSRVQPV